MTSSELSLAIRVLKDLSSETEDENNIVDLGELFDNCLKLQRLIENASVSSNDKLFQEAISVCIKSLEKCTTIVNTLELFCSNETIDEVQTSSVKYLILPALLGFLNLNCQTKELSDRLNFIRIAEVYFKDFLFRCKNYELCENSLKYFDDELDCNGEDKSTAPSDSNAIRQKKIEQYKVKKELEEKEKKLKFALEKPEFEEYVREYYLILLERWILIAVEELENIKREKDILKTIPNKDSSKSIKESFQETKPLKPIIITKNEIQKKVFGLGYPSIPIMTVDDFYFQRFHKQITEQKAQPSTLSLQEKALRGEGLAKDEEEIEKEELLDKDDPICLMRARQWDEWKDDNPRGSGNRKNKG